MNTTDDLLIEIGCTELPPKSLHALSEHLHVQFLQLLDKAQFTYQGSFCFATPRRLALLIKQITAQAKPSLVKRKGPALRAAFDAQGNPTAAALGFARSCQVSLETLMQQQDKEQQWLYFTKEQAGAKLVDCLPTLLQQALAALPIAKAMRWGNHDFSFVRPVQWLVALFGSEILPLELFARQASNQTYGHRFHAPQALTINHASDYAALLQEQGLVVADFNQRKQLIREQLETLASKLSAQVILEEPLLAEVCAMVEWPQAIAIEFDSRFLKLPAEVLICSIEKHQRCFACADHLQELMPVCLTVSNIKSKTPQQVVLGNQRVISARLQDAEFFYQHDCQQALEQWLIESKNVVFQHQLGSLFDKSERLQKIAQHLCVVLKQAEPEALRACQLAKVDLLSDMVGEFPELQGIMGSYYAQHHNENALVASAIYEHYHPRFAGDSLPKTQLGALLALADRFDTLIGIFGIGQKPTGEKDPFALRRAAIGIIRIAVEKQLHFSLSEVLTSAHLAYTCELNESECVNQVQHFILERASQWFKEQGFEEAIIKASFAVQKNDLFDATQRMQALAEFKKSPAALALASAHKRVNNLLSKNAIASEDLLLDRQALQSEYALQLSGDIDQQFATIEPLLQRRNYTQALLSLAALRPSVDAFFDNVHILVDDHQLRNNRLALLARLHQLLLKVVDLSQLHIA